MVGERRTATGLVVVRAASSEGERVGRMAPSPCDWCGGIASQPWMERCPRVGRGIPPARPRGEEAWQSTPLFPRNRFARRRCGVSCFSPAISACLGLHPMPPHSTEHRTAGGNHVHRHGGATVRCPNATRRSRWNCWTNTARSCGPRFPGTRAMKSSPPGTAFSWSSPVPHCRARATEIQHPMRKRNESRSPERRGVDPHWIHLGMLCVAKTTCSGTVSTSRPHRTAGEPGGICVSRAVYEQIENKWTTRSCSRAGPALKNIQATVEVYRLLLDETA